MELLLKQANTLSREWAAQCTSEAQVLVEAAHVDRLVDAIIYLSDEPDIQEALKRMARKVMQPGNRNPSQGKDMLWEVVLLADLKRDGLSARAAEPDIVVEFETGNYYIACKKIWSPENVEKQINKASDQLKPFKNRIIALNLDDLSPAYSVFASQNRDAGMEFLHNCNGAFVVRNQQVLSKAVIENKCDGFIISTTAVAMLKEEKEPFNLIIQATLWPSEDTTPKACSQFQAFYKHWTNP